MRESLAAIHANFEELAAAGVARERKQLPPCEFWLRMMDAAVPHERPITFAARLTFLLSWWAPAALLLTLIFAGFAAVARPFDAIVEAIEFSGITKRTRGVVVASGPTKGSIGDDRIFRIDVGFPYRDRLVRAVSHKTGGGIAVGKAVTVEYPISGPNRGRVVGLRRSPSGWVATRVIGAFLAIPLSVIVGRLIYRSGQLRWLRWGTALECVLTSIEEVPGLGDDPSYRYRFRTESGCSSDEHVAETNDRTGLPSIGNHVLVIRQDEETELRWKLVNWPNQSPESLRLDEAGVLRLNRDGVLLACLIGGLAVNVCAAFYFGYIRGSAIPPLIGEFE